MLLGYFYGKEIIRRWFVCQHGNCYISVSLTIIISVFWHNLFSASRFICIVLHGWFMNHLLLCIAYLFLCFQKFCSFTISSSTISSLKESNQFFVNLNICLCHSITAHSRLCYDNELISLPFSISSIHRMVIFSYFLWALSWNWCKSLKWALLEISWLDNILVRFVFHLYLVK